MASSNPNNYPGAQIDSVVGNVGKVQFPAYDKQGTKGYKEVTVAVGQGYKGQDGQWVDTQTAWYAHTDKSEAIDALGLEPGDKVRIDDAKLETRTYTKGDGSEGIGLNLRFGKLTIVQKKNGGQAQQAAPAQGTDGDYF